MSLLKNSSKKQVFSSSGSETANRAAHFLKDLDEYPHNIHPALVPGVSIEDQKIRYGIDKPLLIGVASLVIGFILWGIFSPQSVLTTSSAALNWTMLNMGWLFNSLAIFLPVFLLTIGFSRFGKIPLGLDGEEPQYSTLSWAAMLFGAGIGIGIIFFGALEPLTFYLSPLPGTYEGVSSAAIRGALAQSALHWGPTAWAFYGIVGLAIGYVSFRKGRVPLMSSILTPVFGGESTSVWARLVDGMAIIATLFGTAASLGIGAMQITSGVKLVSGWSDLGNAFAIGLIVVLTIGTIISAVSGVGKGIRRLSNINLALAVILALFFFIAGPTVFIITILPGVIAEYFNQLPTMLGATMADSPQTQVFLSGWTTFYWAWWVSWAPFVGVFTAKISKGRTIRQFVTGVLFIPSSIIIVAFTFLGGTAIFKQRELQELAVGNDISMLPPSEEVFFRVLDYLPGATVIAPVVMLMLAVFFITSSDSASLVNSQLSQKGNPEPNRWITGFWAVLMAGIAVVILLMGGKTALSGLQNLVTVTALPFSVIIVLMCFALVKELRTDPMMIREHYEQTAISNAVRYGIEEHGDNFELAVEPVDPESDRGVGNDFDSTAEEYTDWYIRTDEDGNPVEYDYEQGAYIDPETGEPENKSE
ncbi:transporter, betaine/carnitine/choline family [Gleimia coleocanis DSM 15436]|uniref:Transporter, betaine/carnitine/choline family n=1 Tax=Gleimia coleocanis DSM 15436 TaxID=525245 RepID=C0W093_9ACTO|nr:BCCT family transporter [Gleimia coleocanis]EEH63952.1 transporter, betaine/carnitine/choline family [Gleimia coleocanis DSM 15436]